MSRKNTKKKIRYIVGCVALSVLLAVSTYISLVVIGVMADENKKGTLFGGSGNNHSVNTPAVDGDSYNQNSGNVVANNGEGQNNSGVAVPDSSYNSNNSGVSNQSQVNNQASQLPQANALKDENKTKADIVKIYADVMNNAKAKAPGFTKIEYQELPDGPENRVISEGEEHAGDEAVNKMLNFVQGLGVFVPKEEAEKEPYVHQKGDADMARFPVFDRAKGSYLTDPNGIEGFTYKLLPNGNVKMTFVLVSENNPEPIGENESVSPSYTGAVFSPMSKERIDGTVYHPIVTVFAKNIKYSLKYHDCTVAVEFNPNTLEIVYLEQIARVSIKGSGDVVGAGHIGLERQELIGTVIIKDLDY